MKGTVMYVHERGYGTILTDDGERLFFAARHVDRTSYRPFDDLRPGDVVSIGTISNSTTGPHREAGHVQWVADAPEEAA